MAKIHGKFTRIYINGVDLSTFLNSAETDVAIDTAESSAFGQEDKTYVQGQKTATHRLQGHYDDTPGATGIDTFLDSLIDISTTPILAIVRNDVIDARGDAGAADEMTSYNKTSPVAGVVGVSVDFQVSGGYDPIISVFAKAELQTSAPGGTTLAFNNPATALTNGAVGHLHCFAAPTGSPVVKIQHSADGSTGWTDLIAFATVTGIEAQRVTVAGTVQPYWKVIEDGGGTLTCWVGISVNDDN